MNNFPCRCGHKFGNHVNSSIRSKDGWWECYICDCISGGRMTNLEYLEYKAYFNKNCIFELMSRFVDLF